MEYTLWKLVSEKAKRMKYLKVKSLLQKHPNQLGTHPREMILEIQKKTIWNIPLRKSLQKKQIVLNHVRSESDMFIIFQI